MSSYIDRNAIGIGYARRDMFIDPAYADGWNAAIEILENTPGADVEPIRHGEWVQIDKYDKESNVYCSNCLQEFSYIDGVCYLVTGFRLPHYCPFCGAKMDKGEADT